MSDLSIKAKIHRSKFSQELAGIKTEAGKNSSLAVKRAFGFITKVHPERGCLIKAIGVNDKNLGNGNWIPVEGGDLIIQNWGALRPGMFIVVEYVGDDDKTAVARVLASEDINDYGTLTGYIMPENDITVGLYELFPPGMTGYV